MPEISKNYWDKIQSVKVKLFGIGIKKFPVKSGKNAKRNFRILDESIQNFMCDQPKRDEESIYVGLSLEIVKLKGMAEMQRKCHLERKCGKLAAVFSTAILWWERFHFTK